MGKYKNYQNYKKNRKYQKYEIDEELEYYIELVLIRGYYEYYFRYNKETGTHLVYTNCPPKAFRRVEARAECEKETERCGLCCITLEESKNMIEVHDILQFHNADAYVIIDTTEVPEWLL